MREGRTCCDRTPRPTGGSHLLRPKIPPRQATGGSHLLRPNTPPREGGNSLRSWCCADGRRGLRPSRENLPTTIYQLPSTNYQLPTTNYQNLNGPPAPADGPFATAALRLRSYARRRRSASPARPTSISIALVGSGTPIAFQLSAFFELAAWEPNETSVSNEASTSLVTICDT